MRDSMSGSSRGASHHARPGRSDWRLRVGMGRAARSVLARRRSELGGSRSTGPLSGVARVLTSEWGMDARSTPPPYGYRQQVEVRIEVSRLGFVKRSPRGTIDFISPVPCPWNYGSIEGSRSYDGEPHDAIVLGATRLRGSLAHGEVLGVIAFVDQGVMDPKVIVGERLGLAERRALERFFRMYALAKGALRFWRPPTRYSGWLLHPA